MWWHRVMLASSRIRLRCGPCSQYIAPDARPNRFVPKQGPQEHPHGCRDQGEKPESLPYKVLKDQVFAPTASGHE
ncbi:hypothetical protein HF086_005001 [Spodoptera exigua]|uniref:Uncharacterized protein n=1 Tax=Spodoptera exigua TaxID=7107 RepID=A0A922M207_SPOEX|nr:hypothetical protein HF086_005001 [Spodoptera exigua]